MNKTATNLATYESPEVTVMSTKMESIICTSPVPPGGNEGTGTYTEEP